MDEVGDAGDEDDLRADIGLFEAVAIEVGLIVGAGLFALTGVAADLAGPAVFVAYVLSFAVVVLGLFPTAVLGSIYPTVAGNYRYPRDLVSPHLGFLAAWGLTISMFGGGLPLYALSFGGYVESLAGLDPLLVGVVALTFFYAVNLVGIRPAAQVQLLLFGSLVVALVTFVGFGLPAVDPANLTPLFPTGVAGLLTGAAILYFVCLGANFVVDLGGEVRDAATTLPRSFLVSVPIALVLYTLTAFVAVGVVGVDALAGAPLDGPAEAVLSPALETFFIVGGALFATATTLNAVFMIAPKYLVALAEDDVFPAALGRVNERFGTPHVGLTAVYLVTLASMLSPLPFDELGSLLGYGGIFLIAAVMVAAIRLARHRPAALARSTVPVSGRGLVAVAVTAVVCNAVLFVVLALNTRSVFLVWAAAMATGEGYYQLRRWWVGRQGRTLAPTAGPDRVSEAAEAGATGPADD